jgi:hypothetical protein
VSIPQTQSYLNYSLGNYVFEWQVVPLYENHHKYFKIAEFLADYEYEFFNLYNINESRSGQVRWGDAIYTSKKLREGMVSEYGYGAGSGW